MTKPRFCWRFSDDGTLSDDSGYGAGLTIKFSIGATPYTANVPTPTSRGSTEGGYAMLNDNSAADLVDAIEDAMNAAVGVPGSVFCGLYVDTAQYGKFYAFSVAGGVLTMSWDLAHTFPEAVLGYTAGVPVVAGGGGQPCDAQGYHQRGWWPSQVARDERDRPNADVERFESSGGQVFSQRLGTYTTRRVQMQFLQKTEVLTSGGTTNNEFETMWTWMSRGERVYYFADGASNGAAPTGQYVFGSVEAQRMFTEVDHLMDMGIERHEVDLPLRAYVSP